MTLTFASFRLAPKCDLRASLNLLVSDEVSVTFAVEDSISGTALALKRMSSCSMSRSPLSRTNRVKFVGDSFGVIFRMRFVVPWCQFVHPLELRLRKPQSVDTFLIIIVEFDPFPNLERELGLLP